MLDSSLVYKKNNNDMLTQNEKNAYEEVNVHKLIHNNMCSNYVHGNNYGYNTLCTLNVFRKCFDFSELCQIHKNDLSAI